MYKYRFELLYATKQMVTVSNLLKRLDLQMDGIALQETLTFESKSDIPVKKCKEIICKSIEEDGGQVIKIEGGKVE